MYFKFLCSVMYKAPVFKTMYVVWTLKETKKIMYLNLCVGLVFYLK